MSDQLRNGLIAVPMSIALVIAMLWSGDPADPRRMILFAAPAGFFLGLLVEAAMAKYRGPRRGSR